MHPGRLRHPARLLQCGVLLAAACLLTPASPAHADIAATREAISGEGRIEIQATERTQKSDATIGTVPAADISSTYANDLAVLSVGAGRTYAAAIWKHYELRIDDRLQLIDQSDSVDALGGVLRIDVFNAKPDEDINVLRMFVTTNSMTEDTRFNAPSLAFSRTLNIRDTENVFGLRYGFGGFLAVGGAVGSRDVAIRTVDSLGTAAAGTVAPGTQQVFATLRLGQRSGFSALFNYIDDKTVKTAGNLFTFDAESILRIASIGTSCNQRGPGLCLTYSVLEQNQHVSDIESVEAQVDTATLRMIFKNWGVDVSQESRKSFHSATALGVTQTSNNTIETVRLGLVIFWD